MTIRKADITDADFLLDFSRETFYEFFAHLNEPANMEAYSAVAFTPQSIVDQLNNPNSEFYLAVVDDEVAGYIKLNYNDAQNEFKDNDAMEVERIYVTSQYHGQRIGKQLLNFAIETAIERKFSYVWLGVWEHNNKAMAFYEHNGFKVFSSHEFVLGDDKQKDLLMRREL